MHPIGANLGYAAGTGMNSVPQVRETARWAADAGFESIWVSQVFGVDPISALAAVGAEFPQLAEFGTSVVPLAGRHPLALAAEAMTAQSALDGRFTLGVGPSHAIVVEGIFGESYDHPFAWTSEFISALVPLLEGGRADLDGDRVKVHGGLVIEAAPCPVLLAALGPRMLELAGRLTAGTTLGQCGPKTIATHIAPAINAAAERAGRPKPRIMALVSVVVTDDPAAARDAARAGAAGYDTLPSYRRMLDLEGVKSGVELLLAGSVDRIAEGLAAYVAAGVTDLRIGMGGTDPDSVAATREGLEALAGG